MSARALHELARRWWAGELGSPGRALDVLAAPAEVLYRSVTAARNAAYDAGLLPVRRATVPVISVGNLAVGGAGKTPFAGWLVRELLGRGRRPALLHGGYGLDEPALHRQWAPEVPVLAARDRVRSAREAVGLGADVLVLDDAFQHRRLARDLDIVLVAAERWAATPRLLPRGGWREPPGALGRAHLVVVTRRTASAAAARAVAADATAISGRPAVCLQLVPAGWLDGRGEPAAAPGPAVAIAAIADPAAFLANAREAGAAIEATHFWPDHHSYGTADVELVLRAAGDRAIVTTAKDWVKLAALLPAERVRVLRQDVRIESGEESLAGALEGALQG